MNGSQDMTDFESSAAFHECSRSEQERLFLDVLKTPPFAHKGSWGEWLHCWLTDQAAEGRSLGEIASRMDYPVYRDGSTEEAWEFLERHVGWLIDQGYARVVRIEIVG